MHPDPVFRQQDRELHEELIERVGFGAICAMVEGKPRVAHTPIVSQGDGRVRFHLSRRNPLTDVLAGANVLAVIAGPDGYVSPRWYDDPCDVPTWNYVALEMAGRVRQLLANELEALLVRIGERHEARIDAGERWTAGQVPREKWTELFSGIAGFELTVEEWRPTWKLSQNKPVGTRARVAAGLDAQGHTALAQAMREVGE